MENVKITDEILTSLSCFHTLTHLRLVCCDGITSASLLKIYRTKSSKTKSLAPQLQSLGLESCVNLDAKIFPLPSHLRRIALANLNNITAKEIARGIRPSNATIHQLDLSHMSSLDDAGLENILKQVQGLRTLVISGCTGLVNIDSVVDRFAGPHLSYLDKSWCGGTSVPTEMAFQSEFVGRPKLVVVADM